LILDVDGDVIVNAAPEIGYTHRGIEKLAENRTCFQIVPLAERLCTADAMNMALVYATTLEELMDATPPERAQFIRTALCELGRIASHLYWLSLFTISAGLPTVLMWAIADREIVLDLLELATGGRVTFAHIVPGGVRHDLPEIFREKATESLSYLRRRLAYYERMVYKNEVYKRRTIGVGVLSKRDAMRLGAAGPSLRGSGVKNDIRKDEPYAAYDQIDFRVVVEKEGDCYARAMVRFREIKESIRIVEGILEELPSGPVRVRVPMRLPVGDAYCRVEAARGELGCYVVSDGKDKPYRVKFSTPSFRNAFVLPHLLRGVKVADVPVIYQSFDIWPLEMDK
jgi:NADH-quinone oxidoreductase subunit D